MTDLPLPLVARGKVRELYAVDDEHLLLVASDRLSAYDVVLPTAVPDKGAVLTGLSVWWFEQLADLVPGHLVTARVSEMPAVLHPHEQQLRGRSMLCRRLDMVPVECVARGYLTGSGLADYRRTGGICGEPLVRASRTGRGCPSRSSPRPPRPPSATTTRTSPTTRSWPRSARSWPRSSAG
jgi:phosphoribosylaminoimidazole-succinocarboxamide synthase